MKHPAAIFLSALMIANVLLGQQKHSLVFAPEVGDSLRYRFDTSLQAEGKDFSGKDISLGGKASGEILFSIKRVVQRLVFTSISIPGIQVESKTMTGPQSYTLKTHENMALQATFGPKGQLQKIHNLGALNRDRIWNISFTRILSDYLPSLPEKPVSPGDKWNDQRSFKVLFQGTQINVLLARTYSLQNVIPSADGSLAIVSLDYEVDLSGSQKWGGWSGSFTGKGSGSGMMNFHIQRGSIQEFRAEYQTEAAFILKKGNQAIMKQPFRLAVSAALIIMK